MEENTARSQHVRSRPPCMASWTGTNESKQWFIFHPQPLHTARADRGRRTRVSHRRQAFGTCSRPQSFRTLCRSAFNLCCVVLWCIVWVLCFVFLWFHVFFLFLRRSLCVLLYCLLCFLLCPCIPVGCLLSRVVKSFGENVCVRCFLCYYFLLLVFCCERFFPNGVLM